MAFNPVVDADKCEGCEECVDVCPVEVLKCRTANPFQLMLKNASVAKAALKSVTQVPSLSKKPDFSRLHGFPA